MVGPADTAKEMNIGQNVLTGTATFLLEDATMINKFLNEDESSIEVTLDGPSGDDLTILIPRLTIHWRGPVSAASAHQFVSSPMLVPGSL